MTVEQLCADYEQQRTALNDGAPQGVAAIPSIIAIIVAVAPMIIQIIKGGFDLSVLLQLLPTVLSALGVPAELQALALQILQAIFGLSK